MNWEQIKTEADITLRGITAELDRRKNGITGLILRDSTGNELKISCQSTYSELDVLVHAKPKKEKKWVVKWTVEGISAVKHFDLEYEANNLKEKLEGVANPISVTNEEIEIDG